VHESNPEEVRPQVACRDIQKRRRSGVIGLMCSKINPDLADPALDADLLEPDHGNAGQIDRPALDGTFLDTVQKDTNQASPLPERRDANRGSQIAATHQNNSRDLAKKIRERERRGGKQVGTAPDPDAQLRT
jgi:hypothetical protein